jgi:hypothetical protein
MKTSVLKQFFDGGCDSAALAKDLEGTTVQTSLDVQRHRMNDDLDAEYEVSPDHLVKVCDAFLAGEITPQMIEEIGFGMIASDHFSWDTDMIPGAYVAETLHDWAAPEVNYRISNETISKFRHYLLTGERTFTCEDMEDRVSADRTREWTP